MSYKRIVVKLSGESLGKNNGAGFFDVDRIRSFCSQLKELIEFGVQISVVIGGGNFLRGNSFCEVKELKKTTADEMGMLCTHINALALADIMEANGLLVDIVSAYPVGAHRVFESRQADALLKQGKILLLSVGTGNPCVTTDTCAALRAVQLNADALFKLTKVDGVYASDPNTHSDAQFFSHLTYNEAIDSDLQVMDKTGYLLCRDHEIPILVFNFFKVSIVDVFHKNAKFTLVSK